MKNQSERKIVIFGHSSTATSLRTAIPTIFPPTSLKEAM